jgi:hypothetical protein
MSAGSDASNLGYGNISPFSNVNGKFVNPDNSHNPATFSSNEIPGPPGLAGAKSNIDAAAGYVPGICLKGGAKKMKNKIKNITKKYRMKNNKNIQKIKKNIVKALSKNKDIMKSNKLYNKNHNITSKQNINKIMKLAHMNIAGGSLRKKSKKYKNSKKTRRNKVRGGMKGGYGQYQNNLPMTQTYQVAGVNLPSSQLGLANPPPIKVLSNCTNCVDNYDHFTNKGFPSRGH